MYCFLWWGSLYTHYLFNLWLRLAFLKSPRAIVSPQKVTKEQNLINKDDDKIYTV